MSFKINQESAKGIAILVAVLVAVYIVFLVIKKGSGAIDSVLESIGLKSSAAEKQAENTISTAVGDASKITSPFNPNYYKQYPQAQMLDYNDAANIAYLLYDSVGYISDSSEQAVSAIKQLISKSEVSFVADIFAKQFKKDLLSYLQYHFDTEQQKIDLQSIINYANNLKAY